MVNNSSLLQTPLKKEHRQTVSFLTPINMKAKCGTESCVSEVASARTEMTPSTRSILSSLLTEHKRRTTVKKEITDEKTGRISIVKPMKKRKGRKTMIDPADMERQLQA